MTTKSAFRHLNIETKGLAGTFQRFSSRSDESVGLTRRAPGEHRRRTEKYAEEAERAQHRQDG